MKAMVLAAGVGSRLRPLTNGISKPMTPVVNTPVMKHLLELLRQHKIKDVIANLHYLGDSIKGYFGDGSDFGVNLSYSPEESLMGTAGGVKKVENFFDGTFLVISGDALTDINITAMYEFHKKKGALATIALKEVENVEQYGVVITDDDYKIKSFQEKPKKEEALSNLVNTGIYIFETEIFSYIPENEVYDFGKQLFPLLAREGAPFYGWNTNDYWNDIGGLDAYFYSHMDVLKGLVDIKIPGKLVRGNTWLGKKVHIDESARVEGPVIIGNNCLVSKNAILQGNVVLGDDVAVSEGSFLKNAVVWEGEVIPPYSRLENCLVGAGHIIFLDGSSVKIMTREEFAV